MGSDCVDRGDDQVFDPDTDKLVHQAERDRAKARTYDALWKAAGDICNLFEPQECWNCLYLAYRGRGFPTQNRQQIEGKPEADRTLRNRP